MNDVKLLCPGSHYNKGVSEFIPLICFLEEIKSLQPFNHPAQYALLKDLDNRLSVSCPWSFFFPLGKQGVPEREGLTALIHME